MHATSSLIFFAFLLGTASGAALNSIYRHLTIEKTKQEFLENVRIKQLVNREL